jgi:hypothetical protein
MSSPVFEAMFFGGMAEKNDPIPILDVQPDAFKALLEYDFFKLCFLVKSFSKILRESEELFFYMITFIYGLKLLSVSDISI